MTVIAFVAGLALLLVLIVDVHSTVFVPRGQAGLVARRLYSGSWSVWKWIGNRLSGKKRRGWLAKLGPALVPLTVVVWGVLLVVSFALMYVPWLNGFGISPPESGPMEEWALSLYYSGYSAVTLGVGDVTPSGTAPRLMAVIEAGFGFALFTAAVSYLLSVYNALNRSTTLALATSRFVGRRDGENPVTLLIAVTQAEAEEELDDWFGRMAFDLTALVELQGQYPLLSYFHEPNDDRAMPVALSDLLELATLCQAMLDPERYAGLAEGPTVKAVERIGRHYLAEVGVSGASDSQELEKQRRQRYTSAREQLADAGVSLRADEEAWSIYSSIARQWDVADDRMRAQLGYRAAADTSRM